MTSAKTDAERSPRARRLEDGSSWNQMTGELQRKGLNVVALRSH